MKSNKKVLEDDTEEEDDILALFPEFWQNDARGGGDDVHEVEKNHVDTLASMLLYDKKKLNMKVKEGIAHILSMADSYQFQNLADALDFVKSSLLPGMRQFFTMVDKDPILVYIVELIDYGEKDFLSVQIAAKASPRDDVLESVMSVCQLFKNATETQLAEHMISFLKSWKPGRKVCFWNGETGGCNKTVTNCAAPVLTICPRRLSTGMSNSAQLAALETDAAPKKRRPTGLKYNTSKNKVNSAKKQKEGKEDDNEKNES